MLNKLRIKFIIINMSIVTLMLAFIFGLMYVSTTHSLERDSIQALNAVSDNMMRPGPHGNEMNDIRMPYLRVLVNTAGEITETDNRLFEQTDDELIESLLREAAALGSDNGILKEYNLRFLCTRTPFGNSYIFGDVSSEQFVLRSLERTFAAIGAAAFASFFVISILLARWAVKPVEKAWMQQKQFVADASHELKTPLTVIMTDAEMLHAPDCSDEERKELSGSILAMSGQMRGLVESLLELARLDGAKKKEQSIFSLSEIAEDSAMLFEPVFFEKGMTFNYEVEEKITIKGDEAHIRQLMGILLDNASKYASSGGNTTMSLKSAPHRHCVLTVSNEGELIKDEDLSNLFKRFYRADKARAMNHSYGLGLSIAKSLAEEHRGKIWAESRGGINSFYVELPTTQ